MKEGCGCGGKGEGSIKFTLKECFPSVHANNNSVSEDFAIDGKVEIKPFDWGKNGIAKVFSKQNVKTDLHLLTFKTPVLHVILIFYSEFNFSFFHNTFYCESFLIRDL